MNTNKDNNETTMYRPRYSMFHPNSKGTGCAVQFELHPAHDRTEGSIMVSMANQMTVGNRRSATPVFPTFDWEHKMVVKLGILDLCKILQVFRGETESIEEGHGLFHRCASQTTKINLRHIIEPAQGYVFDIVKVSAEGTEQRANIVFSSAEALGVAEAISGSISVIAFGIPVVIPRASGREDASKGGGNENAE